MSGGLQFAQFRLRIVPRQPLFLPARNKGNVLRGAFGTMLRAQVCHLQCPGALRCDLRATCPYAQVFEPAAPAGATSLSNYQAIPRPFVIRPPVRDQNGVIEIDEKTQYEPGETLEFGLILVGRIIELLPRFILMFERLGEEGLGLNRACCRLEGVAQLTRSHWLPNNSAIRNSQSEISLRFLTPTHLVFGEKQLREPEFHHLVRRLRDRLNALATFYCGGPLALDFRGLAERARAVRCLRRNWQWEERQRRSARTGRRHAIGGFLGRTVFGAPTAGTLAEFLPLLQLGQYLHVGKHAVWGNGWYEVSGSNFPSKAHPETQRRTELGYKGYNRAPEEEGTEVAGNVCIDFGLLPTR